ncbi:MAG: hypothetical protein AB9836_06095 [Aminipila sp.]
MREKTLLEAIEIKKNLDRCRERKHLLQEREKLCWGNTSEVLARTFKIVITDGIANKEVTVATESIRLALNQELIAITEIEQKLLDELSAL